MNKTTFRLSLLRAVEQAKEGKPIIRNANAWLKAAVEKSGAPLVTAHDIEAQGTGGQGAEPSRSAPPSSPCGERPAMTLDRQVYSSQKKPPLGGLWSLESGACEETTSLV